MDTTSSKRSPFLIPVIIIGVGVLIGAIVLVLKSSTHPVVGTIKETLLGYARTVGLDESSFTSCLDSAEASAEVDHDLRDAASYGLNSTPSFFINGVLLKGAESFEKFSAAIDSALAGKDTDAETVQVSIDDDPILGSFSAPVTVIEFSDYECPYCGRFHKETFDKIKEAYIDTGKIKYVFRDFPLVSIHPDAITLAKGAYCAESQGKFWEMNHTIYQEQENRHGGATE